MLASQQCESRSATGHDECAAVSEPTDGLLPTWIPHEPVRQGARPDDDHAGAQLGVPAYLPSDTVQVGRQVGRSTVFCLSERVMSIDLENVHLQCCCTKLPRLIDLWVRISPDSSISFVSRITFCFIPSAMFPSTPVDTF